MALKKRVIALDVADFYELRSRLEALTCAALVADDRGAYVWANRAACRLTGYSRKQLLSLSVWDLIPPERERETDVLWRTFLRAKTQSGTLKLQTHEKGLVAADYAARVNIVPGAHVSLLKRAR
jgi:PAS domain-containing protein